MTLASAPNSMLRRVHANRGMIFPLACIGLLLVLLIPLPPGVLDLLLILNLTLSVIVLVTAMYVESPLEFGVLPSLLLAITLFRLALNVATTRLILSGTGSESAAGEVVRTFSHFVTAGSVAVGAIIFLIIFVIQFVVITKGGGRISEVAARFRLDAMPGKQMAIDADLNQHIIDEHQAHDRREQVAREADFYAAMDGAGRFVRGDAIATVVITAVNILGGLYVGMFEHGMEPLRCVTLYTKLTIGDGLVSQIPAFIVSLGAGLIITRTSTSDSNLGDDVLAQMLARPKALLVATIFLALLAMTGLPKIPLLILGGCCGGLAYVLSRTPAVDEVEDQVEDEQLDGEPQTVEKMLDLDALELELGHGLIRFTDAEKGGDLLDRLDHLRRQIATELGIVVPPVRIIDNAMLDVNDYVIKLRGQTVARGVTYPDQFLAVDEGEADAPIIGGEETAEPAFGRLAYWITDSQGSEADQLHYRVVEAPAVLINHLAEVVRQHAAELLTRQAVKGLLDNLRSRAAALVDEVVPNQVKPGELQKVLQNLLKERVPIRDLETILETVGDYAARTKDADLLTEYARVALGRAICKQHVDDSNRLACVALSNDLEKLISGHIEHGDDGGIVLAIPPIASQEIARDIADAAAQHERDGRFPVVLCSPAIRVAVRRILEPAAAHIAVLSLAEITADVLPDIIGVVGAGDEAVHTAAAAGDQGDLPVDDKDVVAAGS